MLDKLSAPVPNGVKVALLVALNGGLLAAAASIGAYDAEHFDIFSSSVIRHLAGVFVSGAVYGYILYLKDPKRAWNGEERRDDRSGQ